MIKFSYEIFPAASIKNFLPYLLVIKFKNKTFIYLFVQNMNCN